MKKSIVLGSVFSSILSILFAACVGHAQIVTNVYWSFSDDATPDNADTITGLSTTFGAENVASLAFNVSGSSASSGYTTAAGFAASGGNSAVVTDKTGAFDTDTNSYFSFSLSLDSSAAASYEVNEISLGSRSTGTGPTLLSLYESVNASSPGEFLGSVNVLENGDWAAVDFSSISISLPDSGSAIYFRLYGTTSSDSQGNGSWRVDDLATTMTSVTSVPEPSTIALAMLGGISGCFVMRRKRYIN